MAKTPNTVIILKAIIIPTKSLKTQTTNTLKALSKNIIDIKTPFKKDGRSVFNSKIIARRIGLAESTKNPSIIKTGIIQKLFEIVSIHKNRGEPMPIISSIFLRPILSDIVPEKKEPADPANEITDNAIPEIHKLSPFIVK